MEYRVASVAGALFLALVFGGQAEERQPRREVYGGVSSSDGAVFGYLTGVAAIGSGLYEPGWRIRAMVGHGRYSYFSRGLRIRGKVSVLEITPGRQFVRGPLILKLYGGGHFERHDLSPSDPGNSGKGNRLGLKGIGELWVNAGKRAYVSLDASYSTGFGAYSSKARLGWWAFDGLAVGPEFSAFGKKAYREQRAGSFLRFQKGRFAGNFSGGYMRKKDGKQAGYGEFSLEVKF